MNIDEYLAFKARSQKRWLGALIAVLAGCNLLLLGPCNLEHRLDDIKAEIATQMKYGDGANWDGNYVPSWSD